MPSVFISYASSDERLARYIHDHLVKDGVSTFLACISLQPGAQWEPQIRENLRQSPWVFFLASHAACQSSFVQQEMGGAWLTGKNIVPVVWDIAPKDLPGFLSKFQAIDLTRTSVKGLNAEVAKIAQKIKSDDFVGMLTVGALLAGVVWLASKK